MWNRKLEKNRFGPTMIYRWNVRARSRFSGEGKMGHSSSLELMHDDDSWHSTHAPTKDICRRASSGLAIVNIQRQLMCGTAWMNDERAMITHAGPRFLHCFYYLFILFFHIWSMSSIGRWIIELQECGNIISMFLSPVTIAAAISILNSSLRSSTGSVDENIQFFSLISEKKKRTATQHVYDAAHWSCIINQSGRCHRRRWSAGSNSSSHIENVAMAMTSNDCISRNARQGYDWPPTEMTRRHIIPKTYGNSKCMTMTVAAPHEVAWLALIHWADWAHITQQQCFMEPPIN